MNTLNENTQVIVLASEEACMAQSRGFLKNSEYIDKRLQLLTINDISSKDFPCDIERSSGLSEGMMFVRHPFIENSFVSVEKLEENILLLKLNMLKSIGLKLGATRIKITCDVKQIKRRELDVHADAGFKGCKIDTDIKKKQEKYGKKEYRIESTHETPEYTTESYAAAKELAKKYGFYSDPTINSLLEDRDLDRPNPLTHGRTKISYSASSETNDKLDIAVNASYLKGISFNSRVIQSCMEKTEIKFEAEFEF